MQLYLVNAETIYFPQIKEYFGEIISSYDNGNYRSAMVMLYSTIVCDLLLKLKELSDVYSDTKAEAILEEINKKRKTANSSAWEWELIKKIRAQTELLNDDSYAMMEHIYSLRNFSAHPAMNDDYELISPTPEMTVAYIKKALDDILSKPSVFAQNIVDRMSNDIAARREIYQVDFDAFKVFLNRVYFARMSEKMVNQVFKAFWKFTFVKIEGEPYAKNRLINRKTLEAILERYGDSVCKFVEDNPSYFSVAQDANCLAHACVLLAYYPKLYKQLDSPVQYQISSFNEKDVAILKWFVVGDLSLHVSSFKSEKSLIPFKILDIFKRICEKQGQLHLFTKFLIRHYSQSPSFSAARTRFDECLSHYLNVFTAVDFVELIDTINSNRQIYDYGWQWERNDKILEHARPLLPEGFSLENYPNFKYTKPNSGDQTQTNETAESEAANQTIQDIENMPW